MAKRSLRWALGPRKRTRRTRRSFPPRRMLNAPETKFHDTNNAVVGTHVTAVVSPTQGDDGDDFIGSKINLKALDISCYGTGLSAYSYRLSVLIPKDPSVSPVWVSPHFKYDQHDFHILYDEFFTGSLKRGTRIRLDLTGRVMEWNTSGTTVLKNNIIVVLNSDVSESIYIGSRLYYTDP